MVGAEWRNARLAKHHFRAIKLEAVLSAARSEFSNWCPELNEIIKITWRLSSYDLES